MCLIKADGEFVSASKEYQERDAYLEVAELKKGNY
jgi:hypothetical protein